MLISTVKCKPILSISVWLKMWMEQHLLNSYFLTSFNVFNFSKWLLVIHVFVWYMLLGIQHYFGYKTCTSVLSMWHFNYVMFFMYFQYFCLYEVSNGLGFGSDGRFHPWIPFWVPVAILAARKKCLWFLQISRPGK